MLRMSIPATTLELFMGRAQQLHDIALSDYFIAPVQQGDGGNENAEGMDAPSDRYAGFVGGEIDTPISTGDYFLVAEVSYASSSDNKIYDWNVTFTITDESGSETTIEANECTALMQYTHSYLGFATERTAADSMGYACASASMDQGEFNVEAVANMLGEYDEDNMVLDDKTTDMIGVNNAYDFDVSVVNFEPQICL